jgi:hypothetical protein
MIGVKTGGGFIVRWARRSDKSAQSSSGALASSAPGLLSFDEVVQLAVKNNLTTLLARERRNEARGVELAEAGAASGQAHVSPLLFARPDAVA